MCNCKIINRRLGASQTATYYAPAICFICTYVHTIVVDTKLAILVAEFIENQGELD